MAPGVKPGPQGPSVRDCVRVCVCVYALPGFFKRPSLSADSLSHFTKQTRSLSLRARAHSEALHIAPCSREGRIRPPRAPLVRFARAPPRNSATDQLIASPPSTAPLPAPPAMPTGQRGGAGGENNPTGDLPNAMGSSRRPGLAWVARGCGRLPADRHAPDVHRRAICVVRRETARAKAGTSSGVHMNVNACSVTCVGSAHACCTLRKYERRAFCTAAR